MGAIMTAYRESVLARYAAQVADGKHDDSCEFGDYERDGRTTSQWFCHCAKRRREDAGGITPPGPLIPPDPPCPICPRCRDEVDYDDDVWACGTCHVSWGMSDPADPGVFTDDYGQILTRTPELPKEN